MVSQHSGDRVLTAGSLIGPGTLLALPPAMSGHWAAADWFVSCTRRPPNPTFSARLPSRVTSEHSVGNLSMYLGMAQWENVWPDGNFSMMIV